ncbi:NAD(P)H-binding protein [uncultured Devosia sp.]|uniref:NAD(P)H-binding protein n=1 Tax=uncultured Devosia sp. TaxID=211434 RepID=UPI0035C9C675
MIIITGANGQLGRAIAEQLLERIPAARIGVSVRDIEAARPLADRGVRVRQADFADPTTLPHAFEGASQLLLVSSNARATGGDAIAQHRLAIAAAAAAGARRIVYTSHMAAGAASAFPPMLDHAATEDMLAQSGLAWTALRNGFYASSGIALLGNALDTGRLSAPADGRVAWTTHADLAEAAAIILAQDGGFEGPTPPLTASHALDLADLADLAARLLGHPVARQTLADADFLALMAARGVPENRAAIALGLYVASRHGEFGTIDPTLERLLDRPPIAMHEVMATHIAAAKAIQAP